MESNDATFSRSARWASPGLDWAISCARSLATAAGQPTNDKAVILYWVDGGPSHLETYDPKPDAPAEFRGMFNAMPTNVPGIQINELLVEHAKVMDKVSILRSVHHGHGDHFAAAHWMLTGYLGSNAANQDPQFPSAGAIVTKLRGANRLGMPPYVAVPHAATVGLVPGYNSAAYLGVAHNPFVAGGDPSRRPGIGCPISICPTS